MGTPKSWTVWASVATVLTVCITGGCAIARAQSKSTDSLAVPTGKVVISEANFYRPPSDGKPTRTCNAYCLVDNQSEHRLKSITVKIALRDGNGTEVFSGLVTLDSITEPMIGEPWAAIPPHHKVFALGHIEVPEAAAATPSTSWFFLGSAEQVKNGDDLKDPENVLAAIFLQQYDKVIDALGKDKGIATRATIGGFVPLHFCGDDNSGRLTEAFLNTGAPTDSVTKKEQTIAQHASTGGFPTELKLLQAKGCDLKAKDSQGRSLLDYAVYHDRVRCARFLLDNDLSPNNVWTKGTTLTFAVTFKATDCIRLLLEKGADPNLVGQGIQSPMSVATMNGDVAALGLMLSHGAKLEVPESNGTHLTHVAVVYRRAVSMFWLLEHGANPDIEVNQWGSARAYAKKLGEDEVSACIDRFSKGKKP